MQTTANLDSVRTLAKYRLWADRLTFEAVAALPPGEAEKERPTLFKSMIGTLNHNLVVDLIWQAHLEGRPHGFTARNGVLHPRLEDLWSAQQAMDRWYIDWAEAQSEETLAEIVPFTFISGEKSAMTRADMLRHVVNHATFHRGWVAEMFFQVPAKMPAGDLPDFLKTLC
ncbi:Uncharacterized damage-inducible protein DinB (forms a four-helix bundle) [Enhydrobacter aerosaccus]|uniref:Uncharacterized damage-inducible protein DinB (Forms a four-helix bundle) n=1 Tax=Enhydrobacter aerosaccus TaxID=225324 RepID=A0A1T4JU23_9HYPH|nr:DinB family protein [Enhydrobacter aerosaccus]SJZ33722.1 Uncharacterized damage-inducible protein DinB (forms a four-helix bundle) [Enhydrobacter aerosaccus]